MNTILAGHNETHYPEGMPVFIAVYGLHIADSPAHQCLFDRIVIQKWDIDNTMLELYLYMGSGEMEEYNQKVLNQAVAEADAGRQICRNQPQPSELLPVAAA